MRGPRVAAAPPTSSRAERVRNYWSQLWALESRVLLCTGYQAYYSVHAQFWTLALVFGSLFYNFQKAGFLFSVRCCRANPRSLRHAAID